MVTRPTNGSVVWPTYANVGMNPRQSKLSAFTALCRLLINPNANSQVIENILNTGDFNESQYRLLFAHIRQPVIDMLWELRQLGLWILRAEKLGVVYANSNTIEISVARFSDKHSFQREQDELLEIGDGGVEEVRDMVVQHVGVLREGTVRLVELRARKEKLTKAQCVGSMKL